MRHLLKPIDQIWIEQKLVIKTAVKPSRPKLPSKRPLGAFYDIARQGLEISGLYSKYNLQQYDPQVYVDKYTYKPHKRVAGYLGKKLWSKTKTSYNKLRKTRRRRYTSIIYYNNGFLASKSSNRSEQYR